MKGNNKRYGIGLIVFLFGCVGIAENVTSGRGSFMISSIFFAIGFAILLDDFIWNN